MSGFEGISNGTATNRTELLDARTRLPELTVRDRTQRLRTVRGGRQIRPERRATGLRSEEISVSWDEGVLNVAAEHQDENRGQRKTYHRRFRFPKTVEDDEITARYNNGVLEIRLPVEAGATATGTEIEIQS